MPYYEHKMTDEEIARDLRMAKNPKKQIQILADITQIQKSRIRAVYESLPDADKQRAEEIQPARKKWTTGDIKEIIRLREVEKLSFAKIGKRFKSSESCISVIYRKNKGAINNA